MSMRSPELKGAAYCTLCQFSLSLRINPFKSLYECLSRISLAVPWASVSYWTLVAVIPSHQFDGSRFVKCLRFQLSFRDNLLSVCLPRKVRGLKPQATPQRSCPLPTPFAQNNPSTVIQFPCCDCFILIRNHQYAIIIMKSWMMDYYNKPFNM